MSYFQKPIEVHEAREVARRVSLDFGPTDDRITVEGLAEVLGLAPAEVERLLRDVRLRHLVGSPRRRFADRSALVSAAVALAVVAGSVATWALWPGKRPEIRLAKMVSRAHRPAAAIVLPPRPAAIGGDQELRFSPETRLRLNGARQRSMQDRRRALDEAGNGTPLDYAQIDAELSRLRNEHDDLSARAHASTAG